VTEVPVAAIAARLDQCTVSMSAECSPIHLLMTLAVPIDDVAFGVFAASSAHVVERACRSAGVPAQRLGDADACFARAIV
jgi:hypothetical protein